MEKKPNWTDKLFLKEKQSAPKLKAAIEAVKLLEKKIICKEKG